MASSIPTARANLYTMLQAAPALAEPWQVAFGPPVGYQATKVVAILGVEGVDTDDKVLAQTGRTQEERYGIAMRIQILDYGAAEADVPALDAALWAAYDAVRDTVMADRTLDGALVNGWANVATADPEESPFPLIAESGRQEGWVAWTNLKILCQSRIE